MRFSIDGKIELSVFPSVKLIINNVNLAAIHYRGQSIDAAIRRVEVRLGFAAFFRGKINATGIAVSGVEVSVQSDPLEDFYIEKETVKKLVKLEENEVLGFKDKLKTIFTGNGDTRSGYREVEVIEDRVINVDNSRARLMLLDLLATTEDNSINFTGKNIAFSGINVSMSDTVVYKEIHAISGKLTTSKNKKIEANFILNNVAGNIVLTFGNEGNNQALNFNISSELLDNISFEYTGGDILRENFDDLTANYKLQINTTGFNNFFQWILPENSKYRSLVDYKKGLQFSMEGEKNKLSYQVKNFTLNSEDINMRGSFRKIEDENELSVFINNLNLDGITLNILRPKTAVDQDKISIFKVLRSEELFSLLGNTKTENLRNSDIKIGVKNLKKGNINLTNSTFDFKIIDGSYKINNFTMGLNDMEVVVENQREIDGFFVSDLRIAGKNFDHIADFFSIPNIWELKDFTIKSSVFVHDDTIYLADYEAGDDRTKITGSVEYSFGGSDIYLAYTANIDEINLAVGEKKNVLTMKEKFLWLNNFANNIFAELHIEKLSYGDKFDATNIRTRVNYSPGYINLYNIENIDFNTIRGISGRILLNIAGRNPIVGIDLRINSLESRGDLISQVFDVEKYRNLILKTPSNPDNQSKYWINKLFSIPKFDEIDGKINIVVENILINNAQLNNLFFSSTIEDGVFAIKNFKFYGLGGTTELRGIVDLRDTKSLNLVLTETTYNIEEIIGLFTEGDEGSDWDLRGTLGVGGLLKGTGPSEVVFDASLDMQFKFLGKSLFIKKLGLDDLRKKLSRVYVDKTLLGLNPREIIFNDSGTLFNNFNGLFTIRNGVCDLVTDAWGNGISTKFVLRIDNKSENTTIDAINTSAVLNKVGANSVPLYIIVKFTENFAQKAQLEINTEQIDRYLREIKKLSK
jgi:hypothetical protein